MILETRSSMNLLFVCFFSLLYTHTDNKRFRLKTHHSHKLPVFHTLALAKKMPMPGGKRVLRKVRCFVNCFSFEVPNAFHVLNFEFKFPTATDSVEITELLPNKWLVKKIKPTTLLLRQNHHIAQFFNYKMKISSRWKHSHCHTSCLWGGWGGQVDIPSLPPHPSPQRYALVVIKQNHLFLYLHLSFVTFVFLKGYP